MRPPEPPQLGEHRAEIPRPTALAALAMAYHIPAFEHADALPLEVLGQILSQGQSSRLYRDLVYERQLATSISANADLRIDPGLFTIVSMVQAGKTPAEVEAAVYEQIEQVTEAYGLTNPPTQDRLFNPIFLPPQAERMLVAN